MQNASLLIILSAKIKEAQMFILNPFIRFYEWLIALGTWLQDPLLLFMRLYWGGSFLIAGLNKFSHLDKVSSYFNTLGIPWPELNAHLITYLEFFGGVCLIIGFASRLAALPLMFAMIVALMTANIKEVKGIFTDPQTLINQTPFSFLFFTVLIFIFGPGRISIDYLLKKAFKRG